MVNKKAQQYKEHKMYTHHKYKNKEYKGKIKILRKTKSKFITLSSSLIRGKLFFHSASRLNRAAINIKKKQNISIEISIMHYNKITFNIFFKFYTLPIFFCALLCFSIY